MPELSLDLPLLWAHTLAWAVYVGGAITMELVLRHAQQFMRPSQVAVVCQRSGRSYRWWSFYALLVLLATGIPLAWNRPGGFDPGGATGAVTWALCVVWLVQLGLLALLAFKVHPDMHARADATMSEAEIKEERQRIGQAIRRMDLVVRIELAGAIFALLLGAALHQQVLS